MNKKNSEKNVLNAILFLLAMAATVFVVYIPYLKQGLPGHFMDTLYQMERIEGLKNSLMAGKLIPRIYPHFFNGYGYGSPLFYSDIFFVIPALLRIIGFSATQTWKLFVLMLICINFLVTFFSFKAIAKDFTASLTGSVALTACQFYLVDLVLRAGLGEYMAIIILPVLFVALYDYFVLEGKRTYLFGVAFGGMLLCHSIMVFLGAIFTIFVFICALISPVYRKKVFVLSKIKSLVVSALFTLGITAYYFLPMLEQMLSGKFAFSTPWVHLSEYLPPLTSLFAIKGSMFFTAIVGLGAALWLLAAYSLFSSFTKNKAPAALFLVILGLIIAVITTDIFPWKFFDNTFFNNIQFTFRMFPYAVVPIVLGGTVFLAQEKNVLLKNVISVLCVVLTIGFAFYQNYDVAIDEATYALSDDFLATEGTMYVGKGEWLPINEAVEEFEMNLITDPKGYNYAFSETGIVPLNTLSLNRYSFEATESAENYLVSLIFYKGYEAEYISESGERTMISCSKNQSGLTVVSNPSKQAGIIEINYKGTLLQKISVLFSLLSIAILVIITIKRRVKK